jgi:hypothetical protein
MAVATGRPASAASDAAATVLTHHPTLLASLHRIAAGSALWRGAIADVGRTGRRAHLLTPDQVVVGGTRHVRPSASFDPELLAEVAPVPDAKGRVDAVVVVINLPLIEAAYRYQMSPPIEFARDLDRIIVHEVYGHALPYLLAGDLSGRCADPGPHQRAIESCAIRRENAVRAELGLGRRTNYSLESLSLFRTASR